jgi:CAAX prenyl protease-like protein
MDFVGARRLVQGLPASLKIRDSGALVAGAEVVVLLGYMLLYIWRIEPQSRSHLWLAFALFFSFTLTSHRLHRERLADLGIRLDNLLPALAETMAVIAPAILIVLGVGLFIGRGPRMIPREMALSVALTFPWGLFQQYGLVAVFGRRLRRLSIRPETGDLLCALIFAGLHLPNPLLTATTFGAGYIASALFRRRPNLFALALAHALLSTALYVSLPPSVTLVMRVGPGCLLKLMKI